MNFIRVSTLFQRECMRFLRVYNQTILSPIINALIFYLIFTVAFAGRTKGFDGVSYNAIVATGLVAMSALQAAYFNTQSTISIARMLGFIKDYTIAPLTMPEVFLAMIGASVVRAFCVGFVTFVALSFFVEFASYNIMASLMYMLLGIILFATIGVVVGFISQDCDKAHAYTSYIVTPLTMLSGTFYSAESLPMPWWHIVIYNPVFHIIDGFRSGLIGGGSSSWVEFAVLVILLIAFCFLAVRFLKKGLED